MNVTSTSFDVDVGPQPAGFVNVEVTIGNGLTVSNGTFRFSNAPERLVFVTSTTSNGNLGGLSGADAICNARAVAGGASGSYLAWLADSTDSPATRFRTDVGPYLRTDFTTVASDWTDLTDGTLTSPIEFDENANAVPATPTVWTNVEPSGISTGSSHCFDWTFGAAIGSGARGLLTSTDTNWTKNGTRLCNKQARLYCFED